MSINISAAVTIPSLSSVLGFGTQKGAESVPMPLVQIIYQSRDISADIAPYVTSVEYTDALEGESDSLDIRLEDSDLRWQNDWYPDHGDVINAKIGYMHAVMLPCGDFEVDEVELEGSRSGGDEVSIKALAAGVKSATRTKNGKAFDDTTLKGIAQIIAKKHKLKLQGEIDNIKITRVTQAFETDLGFLKRVAAEYGYAFSIRGQSLCFFKREQLKNVKPIVLISRTDVLSYRLRDKVKEVVKDAKTTYHNPKTKAHVTHTSKDEASEKSNNRHSTDTHKVHVRAENPQQAKLKSQAALDKKNEDQTVGELSLIGSPVLVSGINVQLQGFGKFDGKYTIHKSRHTTSRSGYTTAIELKRVRTATNTTASTTTSTTGAAK